VHYLHLVGAHHKFVGAHHKFVGAHHKFVGAHHKFVGAHQKFVDAHHKFVGAHHKFVGAHHKFVGAPLSKAFMKLIQNRNLTAINQPLLRSKEIHVYNCFVQYIKYLGQKLFF
jgi:hypothetical protein